MQVGLEALSKMGVYAELGSSAKEYIKGKSMQMPVAAVVNIGKARASRKIGFGGKQLRYERLIPPAAQFVIAA
ncbi:MULTISPECIES: hypothetical protein [unclassified Undibacterium]|uniref:hypothetical protein n=1 Tax=unclassified Undibacterium TaxID=2630295 RepID=UPI002B227CD9|nr:MULTISPECIES: hypothetical protein [unclassified Undibacterium]MEB0174224.1 hypothetical protein [Undibacterium sp. CCC1.1]